MFIKKAESGEKAPSKRFTATNCIEPAKTVRLMRVVVRKEKPETDIKIPYVAPSTEKPAKTGRV